MTNQSFIIHLLHFDDRRQDKMANSH